MAKAGLNTAGPWDYCSQCQDRYYFESADGVPRCEKCKLSVTEAVALDEQRPRFITYKPDRITSGALVEIQYRSGRPLKPVLLSVSWLPQHGHTSIRLNPEDEPESSNLYSVTVEVPLGSTSAVIVDRTGTSKSCEIKIEYVSLPVERRRGSIWSRLLQRITGEA